MPIPLRAYRPHLTAAQGVGKAKQLPAILLVRKMPELTGVKWRRSLLLIVLV